MLRRTWAAGADAAEVAAARLRARSARQGTLVHPADLDGAIQLSALAAEHSAAVEMRLPFAVDEALLCGGAGELWAVRACLSPSLLAYALADACADMTRAGWRRIYR